MKISLVISVLLLALSTLNAEDGYSSWLRYEVSDTGLLNDYKALVTEWICQGKSPAIAATRKVIAAGLGGVFGAVIPGEKSFHDLEYYKNHVYTDIPGAFKRSINCIII